LYIGRGGNWGEVEEGGREVMLKTERGRGRGRNKKGGMERGGGKEGQVEASIKVSRRDTEKIGEKWKAERERVSPT